MPTSFQGNLNINKYQDNTGGNLCVAGNFTVGAKSFEDKLNSDVIAPSFSSSSTYSLNTKVIYNGKLYKCIAQITTPGDWTGSANWSEISLANHIPFLNSASVIEPIYLQEDTYWIFSTFFEPICNCQILSHKNIVCRVILTQLNITTPASLNSESILRFSSGQTPTIVTVSGSSSILWTGDHTSGGAFLPQAFFDYVLRFIKAGAHIVGTVSAVSSMTVVNSSSATANITPESGNYYKYSAAISSLTITLSGFTSGIFKIDFTAGASMTLTGLSGITMAGVDCEDGVFTPVTSRYYTITFNAANGAITGTAAIQGQEPILPLVIVSSITGAIVKASNGVTDVTAVSENGYASLYLPSSGPWTISGSFGDVSSDNTASITAALGETYRADLTFSTVKVFGVRIHKANSSPACERIGDSADFDFTSQKVKENSDGTLTTTQTGYSDFDDQPIYKDIKLCNIKNGAVEYYQGQEGFSWTGEHGIRITAAANASDASEMDISVYYNGALVSTQTTNDSGIGTNLTSVTCGTKTLNFNSSRTAAITAGNYDLTGGDASNTGSVNADGETLATAGSAGTWSNYTSGSDVMVEIPKFYLKITDTPETTEILISNAKGAGFVTSPAHANRDGSGERDKIYIARYLSDSNYQSVSGKNFYKNNLPSFRTQFGTRNAKYFVFGYCEWVSISYLYLVETATRDASVVGQGNVNYTTRHDLLSGRSDLLGYHSGTLLDWKTTSSSNYPENQSCVVYRGIENLWGCAYQYLDGYKIMDYYYVCINPNNYASTDINNDYNRLSIICPQTAGYIKQMGIDTNTGWAFAPSDLSGSSTTYWKNYRYSAAQENSAVAYGGNESSKSVGMFFNVPLGFNYVQTTSRFVFLN